MYKSDPDPRPVVVHTVVETAKHFCSLKAHVHVEMIRFSTPATQPWRVKMCAILLPLLHWRLSAIDRKNVLVVSFVDWYIKAKLAGNWLGHHFKDLCWVYPIGFFFFFDFLKKTLSFFQELQKNSLHAHKIRCLICFVYTATFQRMVNSWWLKPIEPSIIHV